MQMKRVLQVLLLTCTVIVTQANAPYTEEKAAFEILKIKYNKTYATSLDERRALKIFIKNYAIVKHQNDLFERGLVDFDFGINRLADLTPELLKTATTGNIDSPVDLRNYTVRPKAIVYDIVAGSIGTGPSSFDWRTENKVTPVKDQGYTCGSCWAFSAVAAMESAFAIQSGELKVGSEQNLIDCNRHERTGNFGCNGGSVNIAFVFSKFQPGLSSEDSYPYIYNQPKNSKFKCNYDKATSIGVPIGFSTIEPYNASLIMDVVGTIGPVTASINAGHNSFVFYQSGVITDETCPPGKSHSVNIVGYGSENSTVSGKVLDYWICKNSWSTDWGENGYFKILRGKNICGIEGVLSIPIASDTISS